MIGIIVNAVTSSLAALLGVGLNNRISERFTTAILGVIALGLSAMGIQGAVQRSKVCSSSWPAWSSAPSLERLSASKTG